MIGDIEYSDYRQFLVTTQFLVVKETGFYPEKTTAKPQVTGNFPTCPNQDLNPGSYE